MVGLIPCLGPTELKGNLGNIVCTWETLVLLVAQLCFCDSLGLFVIPWTVAHQAPLSMRFPKQEYYSALPFPFPGISPTQGSNPCLLPCRRILYHCTTWEAPFRLLNVLKPLNNNSVSALQNLQAGMNGFYSENQHTKPTTETVSKTRTPISCC